MAKATTNSTALEINADFTNTANDTFAIKVTFGANINCLLVA